MRSKIKRKEKDPPTILACKAGGNPTPTVVWYKNGEQASDNSGEVSPDRFTFKIKSPDDGKTRYKCVVSNKYGNISFDFELEVERKYAISSQLTTVHTIEPVNGNQFELLL